MMAMPMKLKVVVVSCNISLNHSLVVPKERTSTYLCINDESGEMQLAISDMEIYRYIGT